MKRRRTCSACWIAPTIRYYIEHSIAQSVCVCVSECVCIPVHYSYILFVFIVLFLVQFNDDVSRMISVLTSPSSENGTSPQIESKSKEWLSLLQNYLEAGDSFFHMTPVHDVGTIVEEDEENEGEFVRVNMLGLRSDDWVNTSEIEEMRQEALKKLQSIQDVGSGEGNGDDMNMDIDESDITMSPRKRSSSDGADSSKGACHHDRVKAVNTELSQRTRSIKAKLHTLLKALQTKFDSSDSCPATSPITQSMAQTRQLRAEKLLLTELLAKYKAEIVNLQAEVKLSERRLLLSERAHHFAVAEESPVAEVLESAPVAAVSDSVVATKPESIQQMDANSKVTSSCDGGEVNGVANDHSKAVSNPAAMEAALKIQQETAAELKLSNDRAVDLEVVVNVLQNQLQETEDLRSAAEQALTLYIHQSVASARDPVLPHDSDFDLIQKKLSANQRADMEKKWSREAQELEKSNKLLQETRQQNYMKLSDMELEKNHYARRTSELELALSIVTEASDSRLIEMTDQTQAKVGSILREKDTAVAALNAVQQDLAMLEEVKARLAESEAIANSTRRHCDELAQRIQSLNKTSDLMEKNLQGSRQRENDLSTELSTVVMQREQAIRELAYEVALKEQQDEAEEGMISEGEVDISKYSSVKKAQEDCHKSLTNLLVSAQARFDSVTEELNAAKEGMNDLILEIEGIATEEENTREQNSRLVKQLGEAQGIQKEIKIENLRLYQDIQTLNENSAELKREKESHMVLVKQQEEVIEVYKASAQKLRAELKQLQDSLLSEKSTSENRLHELQESESKCTQAERISEECRHKMSDMKTRCGELSKQYDTERKKRLDVERQLKSAHAKNERLKKAGSVSEEGPGVSGLDTSVNEAGKGKDQSEGNEMLEMTLNMLRCSVCHDRFKEVAITRCFHLFCKPCIDKNLSSRHRKCPACGEKFGQDDVKSVYFTH